MALKRTPDPQEARAVVQGWRAQGLSVGFAPTMGALHEGHLSLVRASAEECDRTAVSIYVNPTQFAPNEDLQSYPRQLEADCRLAERAGADLVFHPSDELMYPEGFSTYVIQEGLTQTLEGASRPTHFRGVLTIVCKLLHCVPADRAYFGHKDFQQSVIVRRMARDLNMPIEIRVLPTVREKDGLAMSSRNKYLSPEERRQALCLYEALRKADSLYRGGQTDAETLRRAMAAALGAAPLAEPDYVEIVDKETLAPVQVVSARAVAVLAVRFGETRLIDNYPFSEAAERRHPPSSAPRASGPVG
ncbi:MAG: pantoate--beta-alanine ligase [Planctomycetes bacterium]|nr:pantoate--beta-alanine ligase [Planctomycetota bacterium]